MEGYEKVIKGLNECIEHIRKNKFNKIPCWGNCQSAMIDALELLKEQQETIKRLKDKLFASPDSFVHCKDCKYGRVYDGDLVACEFMELSRELNWFCADGERKDGE